MARARNIKPGFFKNECLAECTPWARLLAPGLWTMADREGRLEDRPKRIKAEIFPYDDLDANALLDELARCGHIIRYESEGQRFIHINGFVDHQRPHHLEEKSVIPAPHGIVDKYNYSPISVPQRRRIYARDNYKCVICGAGDPLHIDHIKPVSKGGTSDDKNLRTLCKDCNISKGNRDDISSARRKHLNANMKSSLSHHDKDGSYSTDPLIPDTPTTDPLIPDTTGADAPGVRAEIVNAAFELFWRDFPRQRRGNKQDAKREYTKALTRATMEEIHEGLQAYIGSDEVARGYAKAADGWLKKDRWTDDYRIQPRPDTKPASNLDRALAAIHRAGDRDSRAGNGAGGTSGFASARDDSSAPGRSHTIEGIFTPCPPGGGQGDAGPPCGSLPDAEHG